MHIYNSFGLRNMFSNKIALTAPLAPSAGGVYLGLKSFLEMPIRQGTIIALSIRKKIEPPRAPARYSMNKYLDPKVRATSEPKK